jgi:hypothetical protein
LFSYSPYKGNNTVYNASLLGAKTLSLCYKYSSKDIYKKTALKAIKAACDGQEKDGSWVYGLLPVQSWIDSFHTGYNLDSISVYQECTKDYQFEKISKWGLITIFKIFFKRMARQNTTTIKHTQ